MRVYLPIVLSSFLLSSSPALAQNALGDGSALDGNLRQGSQGRNAPARNFERELRLRNAIVTGNAAGGKSFRGDVGYGAVDDFRGEELAGDDFFAFERDSYFSVVSGQGVRGADALRMQMQLTVGGFVGEGDFLPEPIVNRSQNPTLARDVAGGAGDAELRDRYGSADPLQHRRGALRATSEYVAQTASAPILLRVTPPENPGDPTLYTVTTPLRSIVEQPEVRPSRRLSDLYEQIERIENRETNAAPTNRLDAETHQSEHQAILERLLERPAPDHPAGDVGEPAPGDEPEPGAGPGELVPESDLLARLRELREDLMRPSTDTPEYGGNEEASDDAVEALRERIASDAQRIFESGVIDVDSIAPPSQDEASVFATHMRRGQEQLASGEWFAAEERFTSALGLRPGDPMAAVGRVHAQIGGGMFLSGGLNLQKLFRAHPELINVRYDAALLPMGDRLGEIEALLLPRLRGEDDFARGAAVVQAYLGFQAENPVWIERGLTRAREIDEANSRRPDSLIDVLEQAQAESITEFLTDGSLARLCATLEGLVGAPVALRDRIGRVIASSAEGVTLERGVDFGGFSAPIRVSGRSIGALTLDADGASERTEEAERFLTLLASIVSELCEREVDLSEQLERLEALQTVTSTLVGAGGVQESIDVGLRTAIELLGADAGTLRLLDPSGRTLLPRAAFGLSEAYLDKAGPLPADNALDRAILAGRVVAVADFAESEAMAHQPHAVRDENLKGMLSVALVFQGEALGVLRVYTRTRREFTPADQELFRSIARQIAAAVANARLLQLEARSVAVREQVRLAGRVQKRMLPTSLPELPPLSFGAVCESSYDVGGDFYDVFVRDGRAALIVGDVVGKGVAAALLMANLHGTLRAYAETDDDPASVVAATNRALARDSLLSEFATLFLGYADPASGRLVYCNGGHEPPLVVRVPEHRPPTRADVDELDVGGMVVGVDPSQRYQTGVCDLRPGDVLLAFSDGLSEAMNYDMRKFTRERARDELLDYLGEHPDASAESVCKHMLWAVRRYTGLAEQSDDITIVALRVGR
ncbi:unnamed protein product [Cladocopium goreaui]|uniref:Phosphoserine phosphatase RsbU (Sigma factor Sig B regulation protein RsbU) n=1 Tax=Cladocopium goreaui TaxID=2562237 RepID=A0A9P1DJG9_9DINO|nr:unnamed protein product [Cladocopium goreaui]